MAKILIYLGLESGTFVITPRYKELTLTNGCSLAPRALASSFWFNAVEVGCHERTSVWLRRASSCKPGLLTGGLALRLGKYDERVPKPPNNDSL